MKKYYKESRRRGISHIQSERRQTNWIGHISRSNCLLKHVIEGKLEGGIEGTGIRGRKYRQLADDLKEMGDTGIWRKH